MTDSLPEAQSKSGLILKAAREEMLLSLEQVANKLHLRQAVVKAIEEDNYDEFPSDVFLKGYFRTYCRLVNLHETRMMGLLDQQLLSRQHKADLIKQQENKAVQLKKRKKLFITLTVLSVLIILISFSYHLANTAGDESYFASTETKQAGLNQDSVEKVNAKEEKQESTHSVFNPENEISTQALNAVEPEIVDNAVSEVENPPTMPDQTVEEQETEDLINEMSDSKDEDYPETDELNQQLATSLNEASDNGTFSLKASFSGDCWFKVTDSSGKAVIAALKKSEDEVNFQGTAPFHIVIGDATKVTLFFQDELVNLQPFTSRNGRAELTLKPSVTENEG